VVYTKPRWEKKVNERMQAAGFLSYCPLNRVRKKWSDRYKMIDEPLFRSYIFVHIAEAQIARVRTIPGILNFVYWNGKPGIVKDEEIEDARVTIYQGIFMDQEARVQKVVNNKVEVLIESLNYKLVAYIDRSNIVHPSE
jgi:transcription antitermination factor NusG